MPPMRERVTSLPTMRSPRADRGRPGGAGLAPGGGWRRRAYAAAAAATVVALGITGCGAAIAADNLSRPAAGQVTGASWRIIKTVKGTASSAPAFTAITATGAQQAWAFETTSSRPVAWRLTGAAWQRVPFPGRAGDTVMAAGATGPDNVWAFTSLPSGSSRALAWNGNNWRVIRQFNQTISGALVLGRY